LPIFASQSSCRERREDKLGKQGSRKEKAEHAAAPDHEHMSKKSLANPTRLPPLNGDKGVVHVVIETAKGSRNKFSFDEELNIFRLKKVLPEGMSFPHDFGFVPSTRAEDGDPLDVLVLMDEPGCTGCLIDCRIIGAILGEQKENGKKIRNDRLVGVAVPSHTHSDLKHIDDLNSDLLREIENFFVNYHQQFGAKFKVLGHCGPKQALEMIKKTTKQKKVA
jgi:inorganic pyrophosphatase